MKPHFRRAILSRIAGNFSTSPISSAYSVFETPRYVHLVQSGSVLELF